MKIRQKVILAVPVTLLAFIILLLVSFSTNGFIHKPLASFVAEHYVGQRYPDQEYLCCDAEYVPAIDCYMVYFKNEAGGQLNIAVEPGFFPVSVCRSTVVN